MAITNFEDLFNKLLSSTNVEQVKLILDEVGNYNDVGLNNTFGSLKTQWKAYGNNEFNMGTIGVSAKPGRSLTERITNAIDAYLEDRMSTSRTRQPLSPQQAASEWFGRPFTGPDSGLYQWKYSEGNYDKKVFVVLNPAETKEAPTIDVIDTGIGIRAEDFPSTILSLQQGNKMTKKYLAGAFGQGGSSTLTFCTYVFIFSRNKDNPNTISFSVIKKMKMNDDYKEDCYAYLSILNSDGKIVVPSFEYSAENEIAIYENNDNIKKIIFSNGTVVRHFGYRLTSLSGTLSPLGNNLYNYLHYTMFDPLIPFRLIDKREPGKEKDEIIKGSRNRLMEHTLNSDEQSENSRTQLKHYRAMEFVVPNGSTDPCIGVEYWVIFNYEKKKATSEYTLRPDSNILFVQRKYPIVFTLNGQNQGELTSNLFRTLNLSLVSRHIVVHIDASKITKDIRTNLFVTNREGLKDGPVLDSITLELKRMLDEDDKLKELEKELTDRITNRETEATDDEVTKQITKLLLEAGYSPKVDGQTQIDGAGEVQIVDQRGKHRKHIVPDPLDTLAFPQVTKFNIIFPKPKMQIRLAGSNVLMVETDADSEFDKRSLIAIRFEPNDLEVASKVPLFAGRMRWRLKPKMDAEKWKKGKIIITLTKLDGTQLTDETEFEILPILEKPAKSAKSTIPPFKILPVEPETEEWSQLWEDLPSENLNTVAYKSLEASGVTYVYYSTIFKPFKELAERLNISNPTLKTYFETNYKVWIGYHAILQNNSQKQDDSDTELENEREAERCRVAQMQIKQALQSAELMIKLAKQEAQPAD